MIANGNTEIKTIWKVATWFGGIGGGMKGFMDAMQEYRGMVGSFEPLYSIDCVPEICEDYENITGSRAVCMDLFSREQYIQFHSTEKKVAVPPADWKEVTPDDIWQITDGVAPDVIFLSPPCKGFSGLLPEESAKSQKYQALNQLVVRSMKLVVEAYQDDLPALILIENVPRIATARGRKLLDQVQGVLKKAGYVFHEGSHDCGEIGGLGQKRKRFLMIARNEKKLPLFVYQPPKKPYKTLGDVIGPLPMPGNTDACGPMHKLPNLHWKVWMRLALIPAGGDWRDLEKIDHTQYCLGYSPRRGALGVENWYEPSCAVTGGAGFGRSNGAQAVADPRCGSKENRHTSHYRVEGYNEPSGTVTGASHVGNGRICIEDVRLRDRGTRHPGVYQVVKWNEVSPCVTGTRFGSGAIAIQDTRINKAVRSGAFGVMGFEETAKTVTGAGDIHQGTAAVADPRIGCNPRSGTYGVMGMDETAKTVIGHGDIHAGAAAVADDRPTDEVIYDIPRPKSMAVHVVMKPRNAPLPIALYGGAGIYVPLEKDRGVWVIAAEDGTWHRPLTTFELAMLQGFPTHLPDGRPFQLVGKSDKDWRERIGNAVPPAAAQAIAESMLISLMAAEMGEGFIMSAEEIWVAPEETEYREPTLIH